MKFKQLFSVAMLAATFGSSAAFAANEGWTTDFEAAKKTAAEGDKSLLINFTGSDWCGWCIKLKDEVFSHQEFKDGVSDKFVLVELDYPQDKSILDEATLAQNAKLQEQYGPKGFPTILLTDAAGKPFAATGYQEGGPVDYVAHLDTLLTKKTSRDEAFAKAEKAEGPEKAKILVAAIEDLKIDGGAVDNFYGDVVEKIKAADPEDESGFQNNRKQTAKHDEVMQEIMGLLDQQDADGAIALIDKTSKEGELTGEHLQKVAGIKGMILARTAKLDEALKAFEEAKAIAPEGEVVKEIDQWIVNVKQMQAEPSDAAETEEE